MSQPENSPISNENVKPSLFTEPPKEGGGLNGKVIGIATVAVLVVVAVVLSVTRHRGPVVDPHVAMAADPYAASLAISGIEMSEASNGANETSTYIDGKITNNGTQTLTGITVQAAFNVANAGVDLQAGSAQTASGANVKIETLAMPLIRMREPYVDLQPVAAAPVKPGETREFRLIFEKMPDGWDTQPPVIRVVKVQFQ